MLKSCVLPTLTPGIRGAPRTCLSQLKAAWSAWRRPLTLTKPKSQSSCREVHTQKKHANILSFTSEKICELGFRAATISRCSFLLVRFTKKYPVRSQSEYFGPLNSKHELKGEYKKTTLQSKLQVLGIMLTFSNFLICKIAQAHSAIFKFCY